jgi:hypothetical protein
VLVKNGFARVAPLDPGQFESVWKAAQNCPALAAEVREFFEPMDLQTPEAGRLRTAYYRQKAEDEDSRKRWEPRELDPPLTVQIAQQVGEFERGNSEAFWTINQLLQYRPDRQPIFAYTSDIRELFGWDHIDEELKRRIVQASAGYLRSADPKTEKWLGTNELYYPIICGYSRGNPRASLHPLNGI